MQQYKKLYGDVNYTNTFTNLQSCIRVNDIEEIGDGTHLVYFNMIGMFSFREWTLQNTIEFWVKFMKDLDVQLDYVTIHPDKINEWSQYYSDVEIRSDSGCTWTDGNIGGYCTEFYSNGVEIGNIVNPLGNCIDVGFGLERLLFVLTKQSINEVDVLKESIVKIIESGYEPSNKEQGYVLRKLLRLLWKKKVVWDLPQYLNECNRQDRLKRTYLRLKDKFKHMPKEWWYDTHGIDLNDFMGP